MNKLVFYSAAILLLGLFSSAKPDTRSTQTGDQIIGDWMDESKETIVHCYKVDNQYYGRLLWVENESNPGHALPSDEQYWINSIVMSHFIYKEGEWVNGTIYQPRTDRTFSAFVRMLQSGKLKVTGYIFLPIFSQSAIFTRVNTPAINHE